MAFLAIFTLQHSLTAFLISIARLSKIFRKTIIIFPPDPWLGDYGIDARLLESLAGQLIHPLVPSTRPPAPPSTVCPLSEVAE